MKIIVTSDFHGAKEVMEPLNSLIDNESPDVVVFCGDIVKGYARGNEWLSSKKLGRKPDKEKNEIKNEEKEDLMLYDYFYKNIRKKAPVLVVLGNMDAPESRYFSALPKMENIYPLHEQLFFKEKYVFAGFGGEITRDEEEKFFVLRYPKEKIRGLVEKIKKVNKEKILVLHSPPVCKVGKEGNIVVGSDAVNEIIHELKPKLLFCGHAHKASGTDMVGDTLCVNPGPLKYRNAAVVDSEKMDVKFVKLERCLDE
ncbi:MAG: metallophosphoesterase family protein [Thermoplasmatales archaeon]|nr:metallophosphoesterase family protein [Thermoplasmatales archaeon]